MTSGTNRSSSNVLETPPVPHTRKSTSASKCGILGTPSGWTLDRLLIRDRPDTLEAAWREGLKLLAQLENALAASPTSDIAEELWERKIAKLREEPIQKPTIIGVMGSTGAGKSSVINAILDEDDIIPTSCMRACTAVVTEIMYNHDEIPYRAEIEYLTRSAWEAELTILLDELLDENGQVSNDYTDETSLAGAAYSKIRAVYPKMTRTEFEGRDVKMMADKVANLLEETNNPQKLSGTDPRIFRTALKEFVDSKDKRFGQSTLATTGDSLTDEERQLWPLIKVVRIYVKSRALSTGVILVDLPGLADANAGRAKVARDYYIEHAKSIWIVAPIIRAVDDGVAKTLLGDSMKRQLVMDGSLKSITFVCSKTDEIDFTKAQQRPEVAENLQPLRKEEARLNNTRGELTDGIKEYRKTKEIYQGKYEEADRELKEWKDRKECLEKGIKVPVPHMETTEQRPRKRRRHAEPEASAELQLLTPEQVRAEMTTLQIEKQSAGCEVATLVKLIEKHQGDRARVVKDLKRNQSAIRFACIQQRNAYSVQTMQNQFASGNETFDRDLAAEEGVEWHPRKDYDALKGELPVFCVSANGYQSLEGRRHKDAVVAGFANAEQTQIPELRRHCMSMTNEPRMAGYKRFLNSLSTLTYRLVASLPRDNNAFDMSKHWMITEESRLRKDMEKLALNVTSAVNVCGGKIHDALRERILERLGNIKNAVISADVLL
ncbi:MAG: hypothetical protein LQ352_007658 [Teloschistes flavicans]|nr:MAG: hypothetical protein LQ352_007658 [Teloschistes flavicans]